MRADVPAPPSREAAIATAAEAVRSARTSDRDAILDAQRSLRRAEKLHERGTHEDRDSVAEARPLLDRVARRLEDEEEVLDMAAGVSTGHDGVLLATTRRVLFVAPRMTLDLPYEDVEAVHVHGRHFGARATIVARDGKHVVSGMNPRHATELAALMQERVLTR
jgi:Bacterial PH domain